MLTKLPLTEYIPGTPGSPGVPAVPAVPAHTVCGPEPRESWTEYVCDYIKQYMETNTGVQIPWGASLVSTGEDEGGLYVIYSLCRTVVKYGPPGDVVCVDYPEQPGSPAVPAIPPVPPQTKVTNLYGWDAGANSKTVIDGPCRVRFTQPVVVGCVLGLTTDRAAVPAVGRYAHAFYFYQTSSGAPRFALREFDRVFQSDNTYAPDDTFEIRFAGGRAEYFHNDVSIRRSRSAATGELSVGTTLYASGDRAPGSGGLS